MFPDLIQNIDKWLFYAINRGTANSLFDSFMPFVTNGQHWLLVYIFLFGWLLWKGGTKGRVTAIILILAIISVDHANSSLIKDIFARLRPCHVLTDVRLLVPCGGGLSFPSSHAVNNFTGAVILSYFYRQYKWIYFAIATIIAFSRVYVGVHYPLDVIGGAILGMIFGIIFLYIWTIVQKKWFREFKIL